jgi:hypothetical protein
LREEICEKEGKRTEGGTKEVSDKKRRKKVEAIKVSFAATNSFLILGLCKLSFFFFFPASCKNHDHITLYSSLYLLYE